jgi:hypothetical protein
MEFCFLCKTKISQFDTKQGTLVQLLISKKEKKRKRRWKESFEKSAKELFQFIRDQETKKNILLVKKEENKSDFQKIILWKSVFSLKMSPKGNLWHSGLLKKTNTKSEKWKFYHCGWIQRGTEYKRKVSTANLTTSKLESIQLQKIPFIL